jgi:hypothetical protein
MFASTTTLQMSTVAINVSTTHLPSCNQREYDPPMCASTDPDVCKQLQIALAGPNEQSGALRIASRPKPLQVFRSSAWSAAIGRSGSPEASDRFLPGRSQPRPAWSLHLRRAGALGFFCLDTTH